MTKRPKTGIFDSGRPDLAQEADRMFSGGEQSEIERLREQVAAQQAVIDRLNETARAACDALGEIAMKPYRAEEVVERWQNERTEIAMSRAAASTGKDTQE